jgi:hypothetical protein
MLGVYSMSEKKEVLFVVKVGEKEIPVTPEVLKIVREYVKTPMTLEELAGKLGLDSWEEAYEFVKALPLWIMWTPPSLWEYRRRWIMEKASQKNE